LQQQYKNNFSTYITNTLYSRAEQPTHTALKPALKSTDRYAFSDKTILKVIGD